MSGPTKRKSCETGVGQRLVVELDVEVDDRDAGIDGALGGGDEADRVGGGEADQVDLLRDEVLDGVDLRVDVGLGVHADRDQLEVAALAWRT